MSKKNNKKWTNQQLIEAVKQSISIVGVLKILKMDPSGKNYKSMHQAFKNLNIDISHFLGKGHLKNKKT